MVAVLVVSPTEATRADVATALRRAGLRLESVRTPCEAPPVPSAFDVIVLDIEAQIEEGLALIQRASEAEPPVPVVVILPAETSQTVVACFHAGAEQCVVRPLRLEVLAAAVEAAVAARTLAAQTAAGTRWLRKALRDANREIASERSRVAEYSIAAFEALMAALEAKDEFMAGHSVRVAHVASAIAQELGCVPDEVEAVRLGGRLHDIGMIGVPTSVLAHEGPLSDSARQLVESHVAVASRILAPFPTLHDVRIFIEGHHERLDGTGYPNRLRGDRISRGARVLAVAEIYDALTSPRPYRRALSPTEALGRLEELSRSTIDPRVYEALRSLASQGRLLTFVTDRPGHLAEDPLGGTAAVASRNAGGI